MNGNSATYGGAVVVEFGTSASFHTCIITGNSAWQGGAIELARSDWTELKDCTLASNSAYRGGMLYTDRSAAGFDVCTIRGNVAADGGGNLRRGTRSGYFVELRNHGKRCRLGSNRRKSWRSGLQQWSDLHDCVITANTA
jgi:hypothetical protein